jgi:L-amino acid N-acyltransferase YncA
MKTVPLLPEHWPAVQRIYEEGLATGNASFQTSAPSWEQWDKGHHPHSRLVALDEGLAYGSRMVGTGFSPTVGGAVGAGPILGWAALSPVSGRPVYAGVAEVSIYIDAAHRGKGIGHVLMEALIAESEAHGIWTLQAGIFPENEASIQLHLRVGFRQVGIREKIGKMGDRWRDTALLERRSQKY